MKRNKHGLSYTKLLSCDMGELVPIGIVDVLPGDSVQHSVTALIRAAPMLAPPMHPVYCRIHHWFVPLRLVWSSFENFITGGPDGLNNSTFPTVSLASVAQGSLANYLGLPVLGGAISVSALPFRAYDLIWNEWYRDQDLQTALTVSLADGVDASTSQTLQNCAWEKDYLTSSRPWEQKGATVTIPLTGTAPITGIGTLSTSGAAANKWFWETNKGAVTGPVPAWDDTVGGIGTVIRAQSNAVPGVGNTPQIFADLSAAGAVNVNVLRQALALQRFQEWRARYGSRYVEYLRSMGVRSSDARLQKPEYLGGGKSVIQFSEVLQTAPSATDSSFTGDLKGHGITAMRSNRYRRFFEEHGFIISLVSIRPKTMYMNAVPKLWNRRTKSDFWQREFEHIGQQAVLNKEVYGAHGTPDGTFGYQDRYDEYRRNESSVAGEFATSTLQFWHFARSFGSAPTLNSTFVSCVPRDDVFAVPAEDVIYGQFKHSLQMRRLVAREGTSFIL